MAVILHVFPSLLAKFSDYLGADRVAEEYWNKDDEGNYKLSPEEMSDKLFGELMDTINRVPHEPIEAADCGTAFNEIVDCMLLKTKSTRDDVVISMGDNKDIPCINAKINDFSFDFSKILCQDVAKDLEGAIPQYLCSAILPTKYGDVELYGYIDYILRDMIIDLKTTSRYSFGKFELGWQKDLYPYCMIESGMMDNVSMFVYYVCQWIKRVNTPLTANLYKEEYTYDHKQAKARLQAICERFWEFIENHRELITNDRIFTRES